MRTEERIENKLNELIARRDLSGSIKARLRRYFSALKEGQTLTGTEMMYINAIYRRIDFINEYKEK